MALPLKWMPAKAFGGLFKRPAPAFVTIHSTESENTPAIAESLAGPGWFGGTAAGTSSHKIVDVDSICEGVHRDRVAYHAGPGGNTWGIAYEFCGRASWSMAKWREPAQLQMLRNAAPHIADDLVAITGSRAAALAACRWLSLVQVAQHAAGLCTHNDIRLALGGTTHSDPGPNFPYAELLAYVRAELGAAPAPTIPTPAPHPVPKEAVTMRSVQIDNPAGTTPARSAVLTIDAVGASGVLPAGASRGFVQYSVFFPGHVDAIASIDWLVFVNIDPKKNVAFDPRPIKHRGFWAAELPVGTIAVEVAVSNIPAAGVVGIHLDAIGHA